MPYKTQSVKRQEVLDRALVAIQKLVRKRRVISPEVLAKRLLDEDPTCTISLAQLRNDIARLTVDRRVGVEFGDRF
jgi:hypothetical protein